MKKLMIAFAAVSMAVAANAASTLWSMYAYDIPVPGATEGYYTGSAMVTCEALGFSRSVDVVDGYFQIEEVPLDCTVDSYYTFVLSASKSVPEGTWSYVDTQDNNGYVDYNGNGAVGFWGSEWTFTPSPVPPTPTPTPEPTSGLLLLLGVAGLALRRKQK